MRAQGLTSVSLAFLAGSVVGAAVLIAVHGDRAAALGEDCGEPNVEIRPLSAPESPRTVPRTSAMRPSNAVPTWTVDPVADLRGRHLTLPVQGVKSVGLHSMFAEERSGGRKHEALDILAPRNVPVIAVEDGEIARLFTSKAGGLTIYQFDPTSTYAYYYAHLERYASGLADGQHVRRGQVIGYVGTSGNAPPNTPHLHFAIFKLTDKKQWWQGTAIDPFTVLR